MFLFIKLIIQRSLGAFNFQHPRVLELLYARHRRQGDLRPRRASSGVKLEVAPGAAEEAHAGDSGSKLGIAQD